MTASDKNVDAIKVSIIIKALNEEERIGAAIESSLKALEKVPGEVILADSISTDKTVDIARQYPIKIVQLKNLLPVQILLPF